MSYFKLPMALEAREYPLYDYLVMAKEQRLIYGDYTKVKVVQKLYHNTFILEASTDDRQTSINAIFQKDNDIYEDMGETAEGEEKETFEYPTVGKTIYLTTARWHDGKFYVLEYLTFKPLRL